MFSSSKARLYADRLRQLERLGLSTPFESNQPKNTRSDVAITQHGIDLDSPIVDLQGGKNSLRRVAVAGGGETRSESVRLSVRAALAGSELRDVTRLH